MYGGDGWIWGSKDEGSVNVYSLQTNTWNRIKVVGDYPEEPRKGKKCEQNEIIFHF